MTADMHRFIRAAVADGGNGRPERTGYVWRRGTPEGEAALAQRQAQPPRPATGRQARPAVRFAGTGAELAAAGSILTTGGRS